jgi:hypothetical protein
MSNLVNRCENSAQSVAHPFLWAIVLVYLNPIDTAKEILFLRVEPFALVKSKRDR